MKVLIEIPEDRYQAIKSVRRVKYVVDTYTVGIAIADGTPLPQNATNGDVIQALFPNGAVAVMSYPSNKVGFMTRDGNPDDNYVWYPTSWWNAPYKAERGADE